MLSEVAGSRSEAATQSKHPFQACTSSADEGSFRDDRVSPFTGLDAIP
jgi:hypothetical protein